MSCPIIATPPPSEDVIAGLRAKYRYERDKRLRTDGGAQYVRPSGDFSQVYEHDPHMPLVPRAALSEDIDAVVLGGGWTGLMAGYHLVKRGVTNFRHVEHAGDFGGVWYWNRYPGVQCDNDAYCYLPLLEETGFMPSKKFADGAEIQRYCRLIGQKFGFYDHALFHTRITRVRWDETIARWRLETNRGDDIRARHVVMAGGLMNMPKLPGIPGIHEFQGKMFHTARWDYGYTGGAYGDPQLTRLADKRVAIVGTGATAIQAVPALGRHALQLYVLQRTPSTVDERANPPTDPDWVKSLKPGWQQERQANFHRGAQEAFLPGEPDGVCDIWTEIARNLNAQLEAEGWPQLTPEQYLARREVVDHQVMQRLRARVDSLVEDKAVAEKLKPYFRFPCKRPLSNNDYYPTFNRPNVKLIDVSLTQGVERMTAKGFVAEGVEYEIDCMILASGFEVTSDLKRRWGIDVVEGRHGRSIYEHWSDGPATLHGTMTNGFPNLYFTGYIQGGLNSSTTEQFQRQGEHIAYIVSQALARGARSVEPSQEAQDDYVRHFKSIQVDLSAILGECTPSYYNNEGDRHQGWSLLRAYGHGWNAFLKLLADWRERGDLPGMLIR